MSYKFQFIPRVSGLKPKVPFVWIQPDVDMKDIQLALGYCLYGEEDACRGLRFDLRYSPKLRGYEVWSRTSIVGVFVPWMPRAFRIHYAYIGPQGLWDWESHEIPCFKTAFREFKTHVKRAEELGLSFYKIQLICRNPATGEEVIYCEVSKDKPSSLVF